MELVVTLAGLISIFLNLGMNNAIHRFYWDPYVKDKNRDSHIITLGLIILVIWSITITSLFMIVLYSFRQTLEIRYSLEWIYIQIALITNIPSQILQYCLDVLRLHFSSVKYSILSFFRYVRFNVAIILILFLG